MVSPTVILESTRHTDIQNHYSFKKLIGHGQYGTVREAVRTGTELVVAIKSINKARIGQEMHLLRREIDIMRVIDHPNLISYYEAYEDEKYFHIVMELCTGGDLMDKLALEGAMKEPDAVVVMRKLMTAVRHLHALNVCHRDLKPENFLYLNKKPNAELKIIDFGMSVLVLPAVKMTSFVGTPYYLAPEVLQGTYSIQCDVWSLGVIMYLILCATQPFEGDDMGEIFYRIKKGEPQEISEFKKLSLDAKDLIRRMLTVRPAQRITLSDAISHPWLSQASDKGNSVPASVLESLKTYQAPSKLQQGVMKVLVKAMSEEDIADLKAAFIQLDVNRTGFITIPDLEKAMQLAGFPSPASELHSMAGALDPFNTGKIKYSNFLLATLDKKRLLVEELLYLTFQRFDMDNDGFISAVELRVALDNLSGEDLSMQEIEEMIADWDLDHNRQIDYQEFKTMLMDTASPPDQPRSSTRRSTLHKTLTKLSAPLT